MNTYAMNHRKQYPNRQALSLYEQTRLLMKQTPTMYLPPMLRFQDENGDDRPIYDQYLLGLDLFEDPMAQRFGVDDPQTYKAQQTVLSGYDLWWDVGYAENEEVSSMRDRLAWKKEDGSEYQIAILASDRVYYDGDGAWINSSHPDKESEFFNATLRGEEDDSPLTKIWCSWWRNRKPLSNEQAKEIRFDLNFTYTDGSVELMRNLSAMDERVCLWPGVFREPTSADEKWVFLPRRR